MSNNTKICKDLDAVHPEVKRRVENILTECQDEGLNVVIFETLRSLDRQKWLKAKGRSKTLRSYHRLGLAVDIVFLTKNGNPTWRVSKDKWDKLAEIMEKNGMYSLWKRRGWDGPHCQLMLGVPISTLYKEYGTCISVKDFWNVFVDSRLSEDCKKSMETFTYKIISTRKEIPDTPFEPTPIEESSPDDLMMIEEGPMLPEENSLQTDLIEVESKSVENWFIRLLKFIFRRK